MNAPNPDCCTELLCAECTTLVVNAAVEEALAANETSPTPEVTGNDLDDYLPLPGPMFVETVDPVDVAFASNSKGAAPKAGILEAIANACPTCRAGDGYCSSCREKATAHANNDFLPLPPSLESVMEAERSIEEQKLNAVNSLVVNPKDDFLPLPKMEW